MDVRIDHHEHQIIDPIVGSEPRKRLLDCANGLALLGKGFARQFPIFRRIAFRRQDERTERHLSWPQEHDPMLEFLEQAGRIFELLDGRVHVEPLSLRSRAAALKWPARRREPLPAKSWRS